MLLKSKDEGGGGDGDGRVILLEASKLDQDVES